MLLCGDWCIGLENISFVGMTPWFGFVSLQHFPCEGKSYVIYFYKATKVWLGVVCLLACARVCACVRVCVCGCYLDGMREVLLMIIDGFCFARHAL